MAILPRVRKGTADASDRSRSLWPVWPQGDLAGGRVGRGEGISNLAENGEIPAITEHAPASPTGHFFNNAKPLKIGKYSVDGWGRKPRTVNENVCGQERILLQEVMNAQRRSRTVAFGCDAFPIFLEQTDDPRNGFKCLICRFRNAGEEKLEPGLAPRSRTSSRSW